ncbi:MAG: ribonuclease P protein component [Chloroflexi bacterium]|nr:ribonuclease P protein component [Chloroflexota bacterium]MCH8230701.1 ribonuclease P protein component [Chloroflexota bacterium]
MAIPTKQRIRRPAEFRRVFTRGKQTSGTYVNIAVLQNELAFSRAGFSVSKQVGNAVTRNLIKRRMRHALADMNIADGWDVVVTAKPQVSGVSYAILDESMRKSLRRLGIRVRPEGTGNSGAGE